MEAKEEINNNPLVSVIIIFLNAEKFIEEAIESVFAQTYDNWELLLVDDGSSDKSTDIAVVYTKKYPEKVRYLDHEDHINRGMCATRNLGIHHAKGEYIAFLDSDDAWLPLKLEKQVQVLKSYTEVAMAYGPSQLWHSWTNRPEDESHDLILDLYIEPNSMVEPPVMLARLLRRETPVPLPSNLMVRREAAQRVGGFEEKFLGIYQLYEDSAFSSKIFLDFPVFVMADHYSKYRQHPDSCNSYWSQFEKHSPGKPHSGHFFYIKWLESYLKSKRINNADLWKALHSALFPYQHPILFILLLNGKKLLEQINLFGKLIFLSAMKLKRHLLNESKGGITADPNPVSIPTVSAISKSGHTLLSWYSEKTETVEVRVNSPDGPLFSRSVSCSKAPTGPWVQNGTVFYLQDVTDEKPLSLFHTLDFVKVNLVKGSQSK